MTDPALRSQKRSEPLSREQIVKATIELLDSTGEGALTVRAITTHLNTGRGAIYHYVAGRDELLEAATDEIISSVFETAADEPEPRQSVRTLALGIFDALTSHPWVGMQLSRNPMQPAVRRIWKGLGGQLQRLGVSGVARENAGAALVNYMLGASAQYAASTQVLPQGVDRKTYLEAVAAELVRNDSDAIAHETAAVLVEHDDREQFLAGVDIFLAGIASGRDAG